MRHCDWAEDRSRIYKYERKEKKARASLGVSTGDDAVLVRFYTMPSARLPVLFSFLIVPTPSTYQKRKKPQQKRESYQDATTTSRRRSGASPWPSLDKKPVNSAR